MRITFTRDEVYETEGPGKGPAFPAGSTWDCTDEFALRWVARKAAEVVGSQTPKGGERYVEVKARARGEGRGQAQAPEPQPPQGQAGDDQSADAGADGAAGEGAEDGEGGASDSGASDGGAASDAA